VGLIRQDQPIAETLVVALAMIMHNEFLNRFAQCAFTEENHAFQAGFLDAAYKSLRMGVQIRRMRRQLNGFHSGIASTLQNSAVNNGSRS